MFKPVKPNVNFPELEKEILEKWYKKGIVRKYLHKNDSSKEKFSFLDGPITANNPMGVHHAWGRTYKDFWQRFWNMNGKKQRFQNGFDEQGLWVEVEVEKELGLRNKKDIENLIPGDKFKSLEKFINLCKKRVKKFSAIQTDQSKRLGYFMDWDNSYHTSSDENNYEIWNFIKTVNDKGWLYKGRDSVPWCPRCGTAISQHEILTEEYKELTHKTVVFKLGLKGRNKEYLLAWTTTPWTIPGNVALAVDKKLSYWKMENDNGEKIIIVNPTASGDLEKEAMLVNRLDLVKGWRKIEELSGNDLVGLEYEAPYDSFPAVKRSLNKYTHRVVATDSLILPINPAEGTGIVHIAPGAGSEDFKLSKKEKLPAIEEIDESGVFLEGFDFVSKEHVKKAMPLILDDLEKRELAYRIFDYTHRYPTCWRCKTELVWRVVDEWYIAMDKKDKSGKTYREQMVEVARKITWMPDWGLDRELDWLKNMHDWLISKKRYWGLALPIWECGKCGNFEVIGGKEELKRKTVEGWKEFEGNSPHRPWVDQVKIKCSKCGEKVSRIPDVGNPWLDAGIVPFSTMTKEWFPADFITESFPGQFKNWFYSLIAMSTAFVNKESFKRILGFGSVKDSKGEEMHKSKGNAIEFNEAANKAGVDIMRWLYLRTNPEHNVNFGYDVLEDLRRLFLIKLWNVYSFFVTYANLYDFKPKTGKFTPIHVLDQWILSRMTGNIKNLTKDVKNYETYKAMGHVEILITDLSNWYVRRIRNRVSKNGDNADRDQALETLWQVLTTYSKVLAPFIPFISEEIFTNLAPNAISVHLEDWPSINEEWKKDNLEKQMADGIEVASLILMRRKMNNVAVKMPLREVSYAGPRELNKLIALTVAEEINVYKLRYKGKADNFESGPDTEFTNELNKDLIAGKIRDIIRKIQAERKNLGTKLDEKVDVVIEDYPVGSEDQIKKAALVDILQKGDGFLVVRK